MKPDLDQDQRSAVPAVPPAVPTPLGRRRLVPTLRRLNAIAPLSEAEMRLVERCAERGREYRAGRALLEQGAAGRPTIILVGWACRQLVLSDGRRQVIELLIPGDIPGFGLMPEPPSTSLVAITRVETADATPLRAAALDTTTHLALAQALVTCAAQTQARLLDQIMRLGRQTAYERVAHLFVEISGRLRVAGLGDGRTYPFPPTQQVLADLLGLSIVHVNRTLQQLRRERLIELRAGNLVVLDPAGLANAAGVAPTQPG